MNTPTLTTQNGVDLAANLQGVHYCVDFHGCDPEELDNEAFLVGLLQRAAHKANATVLNTVSHKFQPQGVTALLLLAESHMSIHTWPERGYASVDVFTCGQTMDPYTAVKTIKAELKSDEMKLVKVIRG